MCTARFLSIDSHTWVVFSNPGKDKTEVTERSEQHNDDTRNRS